MFNFLVSGKQGKQETSIYLFPMMGAKSEALSDNRLVASSSLWRRKQHEQVRLENTRGKERHTRC